MEDVQERIRAGWVYQVNLSHRFRFAARGLDPLAFYAALRRTNPSPFMGLLERRAGTWGGATSRGRRPATAGPWSRAARSGSSPSATAR